MRILTGLGALLGCLCAASLAIEFAVTADKKTTPAEADVSVQKPAEAKAFIKVPYSTGFSVYERCIDGVKYLVTDEGGISPKFKKGLSVPHVEMCE